MSKVLIIGGAGYVGSATAAWLLDQGHEVHILDDLTTGHRELALGSRFVKGRAGDRPLVEALLKKERFDCVMHFAAKSLVSESVQKPQEYFENNVLQTQSLLEAMIATQTRRFIFSSTCAVFGDPGDKTINESLPKAPLSPYGETKLKVEQMLERYANTFDLQAIALRYFNAAGADTKTRVGEWHHPETHLIPAVLKAAIEHKPVEIYGADYPTPDGTCIRDYIHVTDLATAHEAAMKRLLAVPPTQGLFESFNLGSESGYSVREVINACQYVIGQKLHVEAKPRRPGDPPRLVADSTLAKRELAFQTHFQLEDIVESAWNWENKRRVIELHPTQRAVFLDRDGTLNEDPGYIADPSLLRLLPDVTAGLKKLQQAGYLLVVISNQSGVARGLIPPLALEKVSARMDELFAAEGIRIDHYELCLHHPDDRCPCRKPKPKLIFDAARKCGIDLSQSYMIGDKATDLDTGTNAGCRGSVLVRTGYGRQAEATLKAGQAQFVGDSLLTAADWILSQETSAP